MDERENDLSACERRLAGWQPASENLNADAMLFAAGLAAGRGSPGRLLWPALCGILAIQVIGLGVWGLSERAQRQALANDLRQRSPVPKALPAAHAAASPALSYSPSPDDYFQLRRRLEKDPGSLLVSPGPVPGSPIDPVPPQPAILQAGQHNDLLDP
jgi:hypothetical protein